MTVSELIEKLQQLPGDAEVICDRAYDDGYWYIRKVKEFSLAPNKVYIGPDDTSYRGERVVFK